MASWNFTVHQINNSFNRIATWYRDFMHRTEQGFQHLHRRILFLEEREAWQGPSDDQVERVLRKILAEKFGDPGHQRVESLPRKGVSFVERPNTDFIAPEPIPIEDGQLEVDPSAVPSRAYGETMQKLEEGLVSYPNQDLTKTAQHIRLQNPQSTSNSAKSAAQSIRSQHDRPWQ